MRATNHYGFNAKTQRRKDARRRFSPFIFQPSAFSLASLRLRVFALKFRRSALVAVMFALSASGDQHATSVHPTQPGHASEPQAERPRSLLTSTMHVAPKGSQVGPLHIQPKSTPGMELHPPAFKKTATAANHYEPPVKLPVGSGNAPARAQVVHVRSTAAAVVGGLTPGTAKRSAATLDGTALKRKPW
jgi:hypothetical protein